MGDARFVGEETTGVRILVVEDDPVMNDLLVKVFEQEGFAAVGASGGHEVTVVRALLQRARQPVAHLKETKSSPQRGERR